MPCPHGAGAKGAGGARAGRDAGHDHAFARVGDDATANILGVILREEVPHVAAGTRWFRWCCAREDRDPDATFADLLREHVPGGLRGPFNLGARRAAGFGEAELARLARR